MFANERRFVLDTVVQICYTCIQLNCFIPVLSILFGGNMS